MLLCHLSHSKVGFQVFLCFPAFVTGYYLHGWAAIDRGSACFHEQPVENVHSFEFGAIMRQATAIEFFMLRMAEDWSQESPRHPI